MENVASQSDLKRLNSEDVSKLLNMLSKLNLQLTEFLQWLWNHFEMYGFTG